VLTSITNVTAGLTVELNHTNQFSGVNRTRQIKIIFLWNQNALLKLCDMMSADVLRSLETVTHSAQ